MVNSDFWHSIEVEQKRNKHGKFINLIKIDNVTMETVENTKPKTFRKI